MANNSLEVAISSSFVKDIKLLFEARPKLLKQDFLLTLLFNSLSPISLKGLFFFIVYTSTVFFLPIIVSFNFLFFIPFIVMARFGFDIFPISNLLCPILLSLLDNLFTTSFELLTSIDLFLSVLILVLCIDIVDGE